MRPQSQAKEDVLNMIKVSLSAIIGVLLLVFLVACGPSTGAAVPSGSPATSSVAPSALAATLTSPPPLPTATESQPVATAPLSPSPTLPLRTIVILEPVTGAEISSPVRIRGEVSVSPFEATLRGRVYDAVGTLLGEGPIMVAAEMGQPGDFDGLLSFSAGAGGAGRVEVAEVSPKDGAVVASAFVDVRLAAAVGAGAIEVPGPGAKVVLPLHMLARLGEPGEEVVASLRWQDGTELEHSFTLLQGEDGHGLLIDSLNWPGESQPPDPATQPATLDIRTATGTLLARQELAVLSAGDPDLRTVTLYFLLGETVRPIQQRVPATPRIGTAALDALLWGPPPPNLAGFETALPTPREVLAFPGREPDWGPRVTLLGLTIVDGVATADFSQEMRAYGGGSLRVMLIRQQIEQTLLQFPTVQRVVIAVEGETEAELQP